jgi:3-oxosteroid 1-dehydrogenase
VEEVDVIVSGTGAGGLTAAIAAAEGGATVRVFEKAAQVGGTTAWSGGQVWIPNNPHMADVGVADSRERGIEYIMSLSRGLLDQKLIEAYIDGGADMIELLEAKTPVQFYAVPGMPDYHPEFPSGSVGGGRTLECPIFPFDELGEWADRVTPSPYFADPRITMSETPLGKAVPQPPSADELARRSIRNERGCGQALAGRLLRACLDRGIEPETNSAVSELIIEDGAVVGVVVTTPTGEERVRARRGVILASGGFEWNESFKKAFLRGPMTHPVSMETNTGDALRMSMKAGAALSTMREAWWIPVGEVPKESNPMGRILVNGQRTLPHSIMINKHGRRFTNEAANYNAFGAAFHVEDVSRFEYANLPCWLIFDQQYVDRYGFRVSAGGHSGAVPEWVPRGHTLAELADVLQINGAELESTVARWNGHVAEGHDPDFGRGDSAFDCWWGDPFRKGQRNATLGTLENGPFYAFQIFSGCLGTKGGPSCDEHSRVLSVDGAPIAGLYAAGNAMGSPFGMTYGGPGGTLGPSMVFGFLAGRHAAAKR